MRASFHHQLEAQPPNLPARQTAEPQYPIYRKSNTDVLMVQSSKKRLCDDAAGGLDRTR